MAPALRPFDQDSRSRPRRLVLHRRSQGAYQADTDTFSRPALQGTESRAVRRSARHFYEYRGLKPKSLLMNAVQRPSARPSTFIRLGGAWNVPPSSLSRTFSD